MDSALSINGTRQTGQDVRNANVMAAVAVANVVKSSLGPSGLDKMLVDEVGDVTITNDGATILKQLEVQHPAAKVLVQLSSLQDQEVGDGTTSVVILAAELLKRGNELIKRDIHPTSVISGFLQAKKKCCSYIAKNLSMKVADMGAEVFKNAAATSMSSKIIGLESDFFSKMAVDAVTRVKITTPSGRDKYPLAAINILKAHGKSAKDSFLVDGYALNCTRAAQGCPTSVKNAKIALLDIDLRKVKMHMGVEILVTDPDKLKDIRERENALTKERIMKLIDAGANVILTTKGIDDAALKVFVEHGCIAVRRCKKSDLKSIAKVTGGQLLLSLGDMEGNETVDPACLGLADEVCEDRIGDGELLYIRGCKGTNAQTIVLRGCNDFMLDEIDRSLHDSMCVVKRVLESKSVCCGGGAVEAALSVFLEHEAEAMGSREQLPLDAFAQALLCTPKLLALNAAHDATDLVSRLRAYHTAAQTDPTKQNYKYYGLDLDKGEVRDNAAAGVLEPAISKIKMIRFATEAAVTILRIDDAITHKGKNDPNAPVGDQY